MLSLLDQVCITSESISVFFQRKIIEGFYFFQPAIICLAKAIHLAHGEIFCKLLLIIFKLNNKLVMEVSCLLSLCFLGPVDPENRIWWTQKTKMSNALISIIKYPIAPLFTVAIQPTTSTTRKERSSTACRLLVLVRLGSRVKPGRPDYIRTSRTSRTSSSS